VDDDAMVRSLLTRIMELERYHVYTAVDGLDALSLLENIPPVDIVITDLRMPRMSGQLLAIELSKRHPQMPILLISGAYLGSFTGLTGPVLPKPFTAMTLVSRVRELLGEREHRVRPQADAAGLPNNLVS
jgi:DNA-binding response OmpR family regulator